MKKLIAYSSVAHMGFVTLGIFTFTIQGIEGAIIQMISYFESTPNITGEGSYKGGGE